MAHTPDILERCFDGMTEPKLNRKKPLSLSGPPSIYDTKLSQADAAKRYLGACKLESRQSFACALDSWSRAFFKCDSFAGPSGSLPAFSF
jgi:hypothetical protein